MAGLSLEPVETCSVRIATLHKDQLQAAMYGLLHVLFFDDTDEARFASVTCVQQQMYTIVADAPRLERVAGLEIDPTEWAVLRVDGVLDVVGAIASLTSPLANRGIPVFHLSTYDSEFVLVPRERLADALDCFPGQSPASPAQPSDLEVSSDGADADAVAEAHRHSYPLEMLEQHPMTILRLEKQYEAWHVGALFRLLFFPEPEDPEQPLVSLTWSPDNELSILAGTRARAPRGGGDVVLALASHRVPAPALGTTPPSCLGTPAHLLLRTPVVCHSCRTAPKCPVCRFG